MIENNPILLIETMRNGLYAAQFKSMKDYYHHFAMAVWKSSKSGFFEPETFLTLETKMNRFDFNFISTGFFSYYPPNIVENGFVVIPWTHRKHLVPMLRGVMMNMERAATGHVHDAKKMDEAIAEFVSDDLPIELLRQKYSHRLITGITTNSYNR